MCAERREMATEILPLLTGDRVLPVNTGFNQILLQLKKSTSPATVGLAEKILELAGGHEGLATQLWKDMRAVRGDDLPQELKAFHTVDHKTVKEYHKLLTSVLKERDSMIQGSQDPLNEMSEEDLMTVVAEAARTRLAVDEEFRNDMAALIADIDPELIESYYLSRYGIPTVRAVKPSVRVMEPADA